MTTQNTKEASLPKLTADLLEDVEVDDGNENLRKTDVWVKTLNSVEKEEVEREADWAAQLLGRRLKKGAELYMMIRGNYEDMDADLRCRAIADHDKNNGKLLVDAMEKYPLVTRPEKSEKDTIQSYTDKCEKWEKEEEKLTEKRKDYVQAAWNKTHKEWLAKSDEEQIDKCLDLRLDTEYWKEYVTRHTMETILRCTRRADRHKLQVFDDYLHVKMQPDRTLKRIVEKYNELDSVRPQDIPT